MHKDLGEIEELYQAFSYLKTVIFLTENDKS